MIKILTLIFIFTTYSGRGSCCFDDNDEIYELNNDIGENHLQEHDPCYPFANLFPKRKPSNARRRASQSKRRKPYRKGKKLKSPISEFSLTWKAGGNNIPGSRHFSRSAHSFGENSGVTIGRVYDLKNRSKAKAYNDLVSAGVWKKHAKKLSGGVGLKGNAAKKYINNNLKGIVISERAQDNLFKVAVSEEIATAKRIFAKPDVVKAYGKANWNKLNPAIKGIVVDLLFHGDYTDKTRKFLQKAIVDNDLKALTKIMSDEKLWSSYGMTSFRFKRRKQFLKNAVKKGK
ncbi:uncharacterized protein LOC130655318 isoform X2 [Hydractinia symbiolongicarpus]|nr:uncharacterized protein LOC130655318 isoform X2 [Hydractinia symbiolongicarpus]